MASRGQVQYLHLGGVQSPHPEVLFLLLEQIELQGRGLLTSLCVPTAHLNRCPAARLRKIRT